MSGPSPEDMPLVLLTQIADNLNLKDLNALRLVSKAMEEAAAESAKRGAKQVQKFLEDIPKTFKLRVVHNLAMVKNTFGSLTDWGKDIKASKPPTLSSPGAKLKYKEGKATVTKALVEFAGLIKDVQANSKKFLDHIKDLQKVLQKDLQSLASIDKKERKTKRGGVSQMTFDEIDTALKMLDGVLEGTLTCLKQIDVFAAQLSDFGHAFSSKYKDT